ncbi:hypothetical protein ABZ281_07175 [Streptomyces sp. NPDC006265]|uniref:hypothetical protein n=1 Tax=Streptomyces sp. NPDC006265 TaxID=3156740 RepID=UPI0033AE736A
MPSCTTPPDPTRYSLIAVIGAAVFLCATILNEFVLTRSLPSVAKVCGVVAASLALSFGIGMLSGGLQHFEDFPERAAMLIPFGLAPFVGLKGIAREMAAQPGGDGHGHGEEPVTEAEEPETTGTDGHRHEPGSSGNPAHGTPPGGRPSEEPTATVPRALSALRRRTWAAAG